ncbi:AP2-like ethylene-responsive transcription factor At2g41710 isoform X1 [Populus nigra]|uniref:AP2-like ethylene-responsive transcription factor At2g41710 isoform X1 n=1 Tax=Populus nigra TaxID=3691 RepID=UPI002B26A512|nr:AP2-like ethylene-responsive transcription factor At2g41710 isoform X1 [Populus nigra]
MRFTLQQPQNNIVISKPIKEIPVISPSPLATSGKNHQSKRCFLCNSQVGFFLDQIMASSSSHPVLKPEIGGVGCGGGSSGGGGGESSEAAVIANDQLLLYRGLKKPKKERGCTAKERISKMPPCTAGKRSSIYRGVTRHRWTGRYEAHLWDKSTWNQNQNKKGKQVYLGAYDDEEAAARAYDLAALKYWGPGTLINFPVTDYKRDLEEMQNVSREEYLASLRRKSSGFSRGLSKYRALSSRWDSSCSRMPGSEYCSSVNYGAGDDHAAESEYGGSFCIERKIDLTCYIKWWNSHSTRQVESIMKSSEDTKHGCPDDIGSELKTSEREVKCTQPYQMPHLGLSVEGKGHKGSTISALSILSQSAAYKSLQEKASKKQETSTENDENENKNTVNKMDRGKAVEKSTSHDGGSERLGATLGITGGLSLQRNVYPSTPFLSAPLLTNYNTIDPLVDPILWTSLVPALPTGLSRNPEVTKTETSSTYSFFRPEE